MTLSKTLSNGKRATNKPNHMNPNVDAPAVVPGIPVHVHAGNAAAARAVQVHAVVAIGARLAGVPDLPKNGPESMHETKLSRDAISIKRPEQDAFQISIKYEDWKESSARKKKKYR